MLKRRHRRAERVQITGRLRQGPRVGHGIHLGRLRGRHGRLRHDGLFGLFRHLVAVDRQVANRLGCREFDLPVQAAPWP